MPKSKEKCAAIITIKRPDKMSRQGVRRIAAWLRKQTKFFEQKTQMLGPNFRARYLYVD